MHNTPSSLTHRDYMRITLPFIASTITQPLLGAVDTAVVGHLGNAKFIGGVAIGTVIMNTLYWLFGFFRVSTTGQSAIALGKNNEQEKAATLIRPFVLAALVGLVFIVAQQLIWMVAERIIEPEMGVAVQAHKYFTILIWGAPFVLLNYTIIGWLMGQAKIKATLVTQITGNVLNIVLDLIFVIGFDAGVAGVAIATLIAQGITFCIGMFLVCRMPGFSFRPYLHMAKMSSSELQAILSSNTDLFLRTVCLLTMFNCMARFGSRLGPEILATNAIMMQVTLLVSYLFDGIASASSVFAGKAVGEKSLDMLRQVFTKNFQWTSFFIVSVTLIFIPVHNQLVFLFTDIPELVTHFTRISHWLLVFPLFAGFGLTLYGIFTGTGTTRPVRNSTFLALVAFLTTFFLSQSLQNQGLWFSFTVFYVGRFVFLYPYKKQIFEKCLS